MITFSEAFGVGIHIAYEKRKQAKNYNVDITSHFSTEIASKVDSHFTSSTI